MSVRRFGTVMRRAFVLAYSKNCFSIAKGAAYSGLLALFPVLSAAAAILVQVEAAPVQQLLAEFLAGILPPGTQDLVLARFAASGQKPVLLLIGAAALAVYAGSGLMLSLMEGFNAVNGTPSGRPFLRQRAMAALLMFATALPAVAASALILAGARTEAWAIRWLQGVPEGEPLTLGILFAGQIARFAIALATIVAVTSLLFSLGPAKARPLRAVWQGALVSTVLWLLATAGFGWYVRNLANYNVMYGSLATVIALLVWMYVMAAIACVGCAFNAVLERRGRKGGPR